MKNMILLNLMLWSCFCMYAKLHQHAPMITLVEDTKTRIQAAHLKIRCLLAENKRLKERVERFQSRDSLTAS